MLAGLCSAVTSHLQRDDAIARSVGIWQAKYAEASVERQRRDTLYVTARARVVTLRDTLRLSDAVMIREYVTRTDSALSACDELRRACLVLSQAADSTIYSYRANTEWYKAEASFQTKRARAWKITSGVLGGFIVWRVLK